MALWLVRAGQNGEYENKFLSEERIYLTWDKLDSDLSTFPDKIRLQDLLNDVYPDNKKGRIRGCWYPGADSNRRWTGKSPASFSGSDCGTRMTSLISC